VSLSALVVDSIYLGQNAIKVRTNIPTIMSIDKATAEKLLNIKGNKVELKIEASAKDIHLENVYAVIKGNESSDAIIITSHIDTTTALGNNYSKGAIDNGSGISLNLDLFKKFYKSKDQSNYDIVFAFVNSEEGFLTRSSSGSMQLSASLGFKYKHVINLNLDCLGEKNIDLLSYGYDGNINGAKLDEIVKNQNITKFNLEKVDYYTSDNLSFDNAIYFYSFDYHGENRAIHTENDNINNIDIDSLENISNILFNVLTELKKIPIEELLI
jgi:Zn-dependent M28 family amino/carboxypeptidase